VCTFADALHSTLQITIGLSERKYNVVVGPIREELFHLRQLIGVLLLQLSDLALIYRLSGWIRIAFIAI
jgi:hypothetical protein